MKQNKYNSRMCCSEAGYSLIELMLALAIGVVALAATLGMYTNYKNGIRATENTLTMQTNARFAYEFIASSLRNVGSMGCLSNVLVAKGDTYAEKMQDEKFIGLANKSDPAADFRFGRDIEGYDFNGAGWTPAPVLGFAADMTPGSDAIKIVGAIGNVYTVVGASVQESDSQVQLKMDGVQQVDLVSGGYAIISSCSTAHIFMVTNSDADIQAGNIVHGAGANEVGDFSQTATTDGFRSMSTNKNSGFVEVRRIATTSYYIGNNDAGVPTLFRDVDGVSNPLVTGVERMEIEYGVNTDPLNRNVVNKYLSAQGLLAENDPAIWAKIVAVRITLTMRSQDPVYDAPLSGKEYTVPFTDGSAEGVVSSDRFARYKYTSTVVLRNRMIGKRTGSRGIL